MIEFGSVQFDSGAALLAFITLQRIAELWWAKQNERRLFAAGGVEYGRSHLLLIVLFHAAWLIGMWALAYDRPIEPLFLIIVGILQIGRFWVLAALARRWTIRIIVVPGEKLVARGPYRWLRHPNYAVVTGEIAAGPLALGLPLFALAFSILNAAVLAIRIPAENAATLISQKDFWQPTTKSPTRSLSNLPKAANQGGDAMSDETVKRTSNSPN